MNEIFRAAGELGTFCESHGWRHCFIGGLALLRWGEARETVDVDLTLLTGWEHESTYVDALLAHFAPRISQAREFALSNRVVLLRTRSGVGLDISLGALAFEESAVERASLYVYPGEVSVRTCSAEDLVVMKAFAGRPRDWLDIDGILSRQRSLLDWIYVEQQIIPLAQVKNDPDLVEQLRQRRAAAK